MAKIDLTTFEGFYHHWFSLIKDMTHEQAYDKTVEKYEEVHHVPFRRYKNFESFKAAKTQYFKRNGRI